MIEKEEWIAIAGYDGDYEVSSLGRVRSFKKGGTDGKILRVTINKHNGYCNVCLCKGNHKVSRRVHVLVMQAFAPVNKKKGYDKEHTIDHIDGNKTNNRLDNLEWCTQSENQIRAYKLGINGKACKRVIDLDSGVIYESMTDAAASVGVRRVNAITKVCKGQRSNYRNHRFAYYDDYKNGTIPEFKGRMRRRSSEGLWR